MDDQYKPDNWAHTALLLMDDAEALVRFAAVNMPDAEKYNKAAKAFWDVCHRLAEERNKLHNAGIHRAAEGRPLDCRVSGGG